MSENLENPPLTRKNVTVKIQIPDRENTLAHAFNINLNVEELKEDIAKKFKVESRVLKIFQFDEEIQNDKLLSNLFFNEFGIIEISLKLTEEAIASGVKLDANIYYSNFTLPDIITVHFPVSEDESRDLVVEIENKSIPKPFLGGFRNKKTQIEYHHAFTQTGPAPERMKFDGVSSRDTQTIEVQKVAEDTAHSKSTQAHGDPDDSSFHPGTGDQEVQVQSYKEYDEDAVRNDMIRKVIIIQRNFRVFRLKRCIKDCATEYRRLCTIKAKREARIKENYINTHKKSKNFPRTKKDFDMLYSQITSWKESETKRIGQEFSGPTKIVELKALLEKEVQLLNGIEKRRLDIKKEREYLKQDKILEMLGAPVSWIGYKNNLIEMDTLRTQRVRYLADYFKKLRSVVNIQERTELFLEILDVFAKMNEDSPKIFELDTLFEREKKLLLCNLKDDELEILRTRQLTIFMDIIKSEEQNKKVETKICDKCRAVLPTSKFITKENSGSICKNCLALKKSKTDLSVYRAILRGIQREERRRGALSSLAFIIQETDIQKLVDSVWHGHSILSQCKIVSDLRLPRWNASDDWSPWNSICLTDTEARIHVNCSNLELIYGEKIIRDCQSKHSLARSMFKHLKDVDYNFVESGDWWNAGMSDKST